MAFFAYWSVDHGFKSSVVFNNASNTQISVHPMLYNQSGELFAVNPVFLAPRQQIVADIGSWINESARGDSFKQGSHILSYDAAEASFLGAQVTITNDVSSLSFDARDEMPMSFMSSRLEGMWWKPDDASQYDLVLSNMTDSSVTVGLSFSGDQGSLDTSTADKKLAPHQTQVVTLDDKKLAFTTGPGAGKAGGISITHTGEPGGVLAYGMLSKNQVGFSSHFDFEDPAARKSQTLAASHLLIGKPDLSGFSEQTSFTSLALLRNSSGESIDVRPSLSFLYDNAPRTMSLAVRHLLPQQIKAVDIGAELKRAGIRAPITGAGVTFVSSGKLGALIGHLTSFDQTRNHTFDVPMKDPDVGMNRFSGSYPFNIDADTQSIIHVRNTTDETARFTIQLDYEGGSYALPMQVLAPQQEVAIDIRQLRDSQIKDSIGRVMPFDVTSGQANWSEHGPQALIGRTEVFNSKTAVAGSFSCGVNCCLPSTVSVNMSPSSMSGVAGDSGYTQLLETRQRACDGATFGPYNVTTSATWSSSDTTVATAGAVSSSGCLVSCVGAGSCNLHADFQGVSYWWDYVDGHCLSDFVPFPGDGPIVVQVPTSLGVLSVSTLATGTSGNFGCTPGADFGIKVSVKYQVKDQSGNPMKNSNMEPQEKVTNAVFNGTPQGDPVPNWTDIGPSRISGTSQFTSSIGVFLDAPYGACNGSSFRYTFTQEISILLGINRYPVKTNSVTVTSSGAGQGSITNGSDIQKSRP